MREREAGDSLLDLGEGWEPIKGVRGSRKSSRTASDPRSARPPCPVCMYGSVVSVSVCGSGLCPLGDGPG